MLLDLCLSRVVGNCALNASREAGLSLLQWFFLQQPYNPIPDAVYRAKSKGLEMPPIFSYFEDQVYRRFRGSDLLSEIMRREMQEEIPNSPLGDEFSKLDNGIRHDALRSLRRDVQELEQDEARAQENARAQDMRRNLLIEPFYQRGEKRARYTASTNKKLGDVVVFANADAIPES